MLATRSPNIEYSVNPLLLRPIILVKCFVSWLSKVVLAHLGNRVVDHYSVLEFGLTNAGRMACLIFELRCSNFIVSMPHSNVQFLNVWLDEDSEHRVLGIRASSYFVFAEKSQCLVRSLLFMLSLIRGLATRGFAMIRVSDESK